MAFGSSSIVRLNSLIAKSILKNMVVTLSRSEQMYIPFKLLEIMVLEVHIFFIHNKVLECVVLLSERLELFLDLLPRR